MSVRTLAHEGNVWTLDPEAVPHGLTEVFVARRDGVAPVLVKFVAPADGGVEAAWFSALRAKLQSIASENVLRVAGGGVCDGRHCLVLEDAPGHSLDEWLARYRHAGRAPSWGVVQWAFDALCAGVQAGHRAGLVHRRIGPRAVRVHPTRPGNYRVWVTDFELAPLVTAKLPGALMAPEQFVTPRKETTRADVFSLAALFLEMLTLSPKPDPASDLPWAAWVSAQSRDLRGALAKLRPDLPGPVLDVLAKALDASPDARPANAQGLRTQMRRAMNDAGVWRERPEDEPEPPPVPESVSVASEDPLDDTWRSGPPKQPAPLAAPPVVAPVVEDLETQTVFNLPALPGVSYAEETAESTRTLTAEQLGASASFAAAAALEAENTFVSLPALSPQVVAQAHVMAPSAVEQGPTAQAPPADPPPPSGAFLAASQALLSARPAMRMQPEPSRQAPPPPVQQPPAPSFARQRMAVVGLVALAVLVASVLVWFLLR